MEKKMYTPHPLEEVLRDKAEKGYGICLTQTCPLREHCMHYILRTYTPKSHFFTTCTNLNHPLMQTEKCPVYLSDKPVRMPLGLADIYYDMPARIANPLKQHLINYFNRRRYYEYHFGRRPIPPEHEQHIRQAAINYGWQTPLKFKDYVEHYLW
jgi:hypothetical protein